MAEINEEGIIVSDNTVYVPQTWFDEVEKYTPVTAVRMNHIELGLADLGERWDSLSRGQSDLISVSATTNGIVREFEFGRTYEEPPIILISTQSNNGGNSQGFPVVRVAGVSTDGFSVIIHSNAGVPYNIKINWVAIPA